MMRRTAALLGLAVFGLGLSDRLPQPPNAQPTPTSSPPLSHPPDWPCACDGTPIPTPAVKAPAAHPKPGRPAAMPDGTAAADVGVITGAVICGFDTAWALPDPTAPEIATAPKPLQDAIRALQTLPPSPITEADIDRLVPALKSSRCYRWPGTWTIDTGAARADSWGTLPKGSKPRVFMAAAYIKAGLTRIGAGEMDYAAYVRSPAGKEYTAMYPVDGSYRTGTVGGCPFLRIDEFYAHPGSFGLCSSEGTVHVLKHCRAGRFAVDSYADPIAASPGSSFRWNAGRDTYYPVNDGSGKPAGWLIVTMYTLKIDCFKDWDGDDICTNLTYMRERAER